MRRILAILVLLPTIAWADCDTAVDKMFSEYDKPNVPGASVLVVREGQILCAKGYGLAEVQQKTPVTTATNFRLASVSKQFTAMAVLVLIEKGELSFDTKLTEIFDGFPAYGAKIAIRHLLHHQSGLRDYEDLIPQGQTEQLTDADVLAMLKKQSQTSFTPGSQYRYSNGGYVLLGLVVEKISGLRFSEFLLENVFKKANLKATVMFEKGTTVVTDRAYGYTGTGGGFKKTDQSITSATRGDGGVYSSARDLFLWDQALYGTGMVGAKLMELMFTPGKLSGGQTTSYGFGWQLDQYKGTRRHSHTGSTIGFRTAIQRYPEKWFSVAVLINREGSQPWQIAERLTDHYLFSNALE